MSLLMCNDGAIVSTTSVQFHYIRLSFIELFILFVAFILKRIIICKESYGILNISHHQQKFIVFKALRTDRNYITFCVNAFSIIHKMCCIWIFRLTKRLTDYYDCFSSSSFTIIINYFWRWTIFLFVHFASWFSHSRLFSFISGIAIKTANT